jgi:LPXTG-motif cell wall-anchored protein
VTGGGDATTNGLLLGVLLLSAGGSIFLAVRRRPG